MMPQAVFMGTCLLLVILLFAVASVITLIVRGKTNSFLDDMGVIAWRIVLSGVSIALAAGMLYCIVSAMLYWL